MLSGASLSDLDLGIAMDRMCRGDDMGKSSATLLAWEGVAGVLPTEHAL